MVSAAFGSSGQFNLFRKGCNVEFSGAGENYKNWTPNKTASLAVVL